MLPQKNSEEVLTRLGFKCDEALSSSNRVKMPVNAEILAKIPQRDKYGSKYDHGTVTVVAGSVGMSGAASLVAQSVLRSGAGMCYLVAPKSICVVMLMESRANIAQIPNCTIPSNAAFPRSKSNRTA